MPTTSLLRTPRTGSRGPLPSDRCWCLRLQLRLTRYRLTTLTGSSIVDAAHIHQFADSRNNDPQNGLALCKNAHWLFDNGLWTLTDDYRVLVAHGEFTEAGSEQQLLKQYHGLKILLPVDASLQPSPLHIAWHRSKKFKGV